MSDSSNPASLGRSELFTALRESVDEVFNSMVFTFEEAAVRHVPEAGATTMAVVHTGDEGETLQIQTEARVDFAGEFAGCVLLRCSAQGALDIARGLLMMDESEALEVDEIADALGECANMVTGTVKTKVLDPAGEFRMSTPVVADNVTAVEGAPCGLLAYRLAQGLVAVEIWVRDE